MFLKYETSMPENVQTIKQTRSWYEKKFFKSWLFYAYSTIMFNVVSLKVTIVNTCALRWFSLGSQVSSTS